MNHRSISTWSILAAFLWAGVLAAQTSSGRGVLRGTARDAATGAPVLSVRIEAFDDRSPGVVSSDDPDLNGAFAIELPPGRYYLLARDQGLANTGSQRYQGLSCIPGDCDVRQGRPIELAAGQEIGGLLFELPPAGVIAGEVRRSDGAPLPAGLVAIWNADGSAAGSADVTAGHYRSHGLADGTYFVSIYDTADEVGRLYGGGACQAPSPDGYLGCDVKLGQPVAVRAGAVAAGVDFALEPGAFVAGRIFGPTGLPVPSELAALDRDGQTVRYLSSDFQGNYRIGPLAAGRHHLVVSAPYLPVQLYRDVFCFGTCDVSRAAGVEIRSGETLDGLDFHLHAFGSLRGTIENERNHAPVQDAEVKLYLDDASYYRSAWSDPAGLFRFDELPPGRYRLAVEGPFFEGQLYDGVAYSEPLDEDTLQRATPLLVPEGGNLAGIRLRLAEYGRLEGRVVDAVSGAPLTDAYVRVYRRGEDRFPFGATVDEAGNFSVALPAGSYNLVAEYDITRSVLVGTGDGCGVLQLDGRASCDPGRGEAFEIAARQRVSAGTIALGKAARLRGHVGLETPRPTVRVALHSGDGKLVRSDFFEYHDGADFDYEVPAGHYYLEASATDHANQLWAGVHCAEGPDGFFAYQCPDPRLGTPIAVASGEERSGLDLQLKLDFSPCQSSDLRLCLGGGRFSVVSYTQSLFPTIYPVRELTRDAGTVPNPPDDRPSLIKLLDACDPFGHFWFFASGTRTNLLVEDRFTGLQQTYGYGIEDEELLVADLGAFATCDTAGLAPLLPAAMQAAPESKENACGIEEGEPALCLLDRFKVEAEWRTPGGATGMAQALPVDEGTGAFSFFGADNLELIVRLADACDNPYLPRFWVRASGATDVGFTLRIQDTRSGVEKVYDNPSGQPFTKIADFDAFATCGD